MLLVRQVFQAKYGRGDELVALFQEGFARFRSPREAAEAARGSYRILTDASGPFFTVVIEVEVESFAAWEQLFQAFLAQPDAAAWFGRSVEVTESGRREFYTIVE